jgi:hypothetical protein
MSKTGLLKGNREAFLLSGEQNRALIRFPTGHDRRLMPGITEQLRNIWKRL